MLKNRHIKKEQVVHDCLLLSGVKVGEKKINLELPSLFCHGFYLNVSRIIEKKLWLSFSISPFYYRHLQKNGSMAHHSLPAEWRVNIKKFKNTEKDNIKENDMEEKLQSSSNWKTNLQIQTPAPQQSTSTFAPWPQNFTWLICHLLY